MLIRTLPIRLACLMALSGCASTAPAAVVAPPPPPAPPPAAVPDTAIGPNGPRMTGDLAADIRTVLDAPPLQRTFWGVEVYDATADRMLFSENAHKHFIPASNEKLLTTTAAMARLGPDFRYRTAVMALGPSADGARARALLVRGRGDPTLSKRFHPEELAALDSIADSLYVAGLRRVRGPLIIDVSYFDSTVVNPSWEVGDLDWYYAAPVTAFGVSEGAIPLEIDATGLAGEEAQVHFLGPQGLVTVRGGLQIVPEDSSSHWQAKRLPGDTLVLSGWVRSALAPDTDWIAALSPPEYAGRALLMALRQRGVRVDGPVRVLYDSAAVAELEQRLGPPRLLTEWRSPPLSRIIQGLLEPSQNWIAEHLIKTLGAEVEGRGTWKAGIDVVRGFLVDDVGIDSLAIHVRDGSGLSSQDLVTPAALVTLLRYVRSTPWAADYRNALASPGEEQSTLEDRLLQFRGRLFAKTGTISNVNSLTGYLMTESGRTLIFSILSNGSGLPSSDIRHAADQVVELMDAEGDALR